MCVRSSGEYRCTYNVSDPLGMVGRLPSITSLCMAASVLPSKGMLPLVITSHITTPREYCKDNIDN